MGEWSLVCLSFCFRFSLPGGLCNTCKVYFQILTGDSRPTVTRDLITDTVVVLSWTLPPLAASNIAENPTDARLPAVVVKGYIISIEETVCEFDRPLHHQLPVQRPVT